MLKQRHQGFTLVELLVVVLLISIMLGTMVASFNTDDIKEHMEKEMTRMRVLVGLAQEEAILQGQVMALAISENTYRFDVLDVDSGRWQPVSDGKVFRERNVVAGTKLSLVVDSLKRESSKSDFKLELSSEDKIDKKSEDDEDEEDDKYQRVQIEATGEMYPFEVILRNEDETIEFKLMMDDDGKSMIILPENLG